MYFKVHKYFVFCIQRINRNIDKVQIGLQLNKPKDSLKSSEALIIN